METITYISFILALVSLTALGTITDCETYYQGHGDQWKNIYDNCTDDQSQQSPVDLEVSDNVWKEFVFLPAYAAVTPTSMGMEDCVFRIRGDDIGVVTTNDVYALPKLYKFKAEYIDFHSKSEHLIKGKQYDLEMQIYHSDMFGRSKSKEAMVVSVLFEISDQSDEFFQFLDGKSPVDLSKIMTIDFMMHNTVYGYLGTRTSQGCANGVGWYISTNIGKISKDDLDKISKDFVKDGNYRESFSIRDKRLFSHPPLFP